EEMASEKAEKCAHPLCSCVTTSGKYCSAECQATEKTPEIACACPHTGCKGKKHEPALHFRLRFGLDFIKGRNMKKLRLSVAMLAVLAVGILTGCSEPSTKSPDVSDSIRKSLDQAGFKDVTVGQDRDKGVVTLGGQVTSDNDKSQAESL